MYLIGFIVLFLLVAALRRDWAGRTQADLKSKSSHDPPGSIFSVKKELGVPFPHSIRLLTSQISFPCSSVFTFGDAGNRNTMLSLRLTVTKIANIIEQQGTLSPVEVPDKHMTTRTTDFIG